MNWQPVRELFPELLALVMLLAIVELRRRLERANRARKAAEVELESLRPPKGDD